ncbi:hypothetical protein C8J57DRAFT_179741 [Mycena rebaudengoi]|nr:hypothetical protein C8J57DRAFT_179741 [Mycena rebaudengoi]
MLLLYALLRQSLAHTLPILHGTFMVSLDLLPLQPQCLLRRLRYLPVCCSLHLRSRFLLPQPLHLLRLLDPLLASEMSPTAFHRQLPPLALFLRLFGMQSLALLLHEHVLDNQRGMRGFNDSVARLNLPLHVPEILL